MHNSGADLEFSRGGNSKKNQNCCRHYFMPTKLIFRALLEDYNDSIYTNLSVTQTVC